MIHKTFFIESKKENHWLAAPLLILAAMTDGG